MKNNIARALLVLAAASVVALAPIQANAAQCSLGSMAGNWAYTYTGTIFTQNGPLPAASVGRYHQDTAGNITGSQTRSVAGNSGVEEITGKITVNGNCTATANINVFQNASLQRSAVLALVFDSNGNHSRTIFKSLTLPDGTDVPVVITADANRLVTRD
ncbi:MAG: hypothetical protein DMG96_37115 [Acidobacteria bacterium]|nr:MAG: hypothetical protein DMG96_37115 [Acidobacteriota bacterium]